MQIGFVGLGKMGANMVHRIRRDSDHEVVGFDLDAEAVKAAEGHGATGASTLEELVAGLDPPRIAWVMVPAGDPTEETIAQLGELMDEGDLIVDGGNTRWKDDLRRAEELSAKGIDYVDVGTSGGVWGLELGYCMMVGGPKRAVERLSPILDVLAAPHDERWGPGWGHMGDSGSGHYVKMIHNGIEYGLMQAYAEGFELMASSDFGLDNAAISRLWMQGSVVRSWLLELAGNAFEQDGNELAELAAHVNDSGEGRWTVDDAVEKGVPAPAITAALFARFASREGGEYSAKVLNALRGQFGGHAVEKAADHPEDASGPGAGAKGS